MQLIKVLLAKSLALVKMVIKPRQMETNKSLNVLAKITKFQQASSKAEVQTETRCLVDGVAILFFSFALRYYKDCICLETWNFEPG